MKQKSDEFPGSPPAIDADVLRFLSEMSVRLVGRDTKTGQVIWRREPVAQGDATNYEFSTQENIKFGPYFHVELADAIYDSGFSFLLLGVTG